MKYGWITPRGHVIECSVYDHLRVLESCEEAQTTPKLVDLRRQLVEQESACKDLEERDGRGEWHTYEILKDGLSRVIWQEALNAGFVRVGTLHSTMYFEGVSQALQQHHARCLMLAEEQNVQAKFEPFKQA